MSTPSVRFPLTRFKKPTVILLASGSEVSLALEARDKLAARTPAIRARVVSMPSWELFDAQPEEYRHQVLPPQVKARIAIEAGVPMGWHKYVGDGGDVIAIENRFGASAPYKVIFEKYGFTVENIVTRALQLLK